jgi:hypothetical protein
VRFDYTLLLIFRSAYLPITPKVKMYANTHLLKIEVQFVLKEISLRQEPGKTNSFDSLPWSNKPGKIHLINTSLPRKAK